MATELNTSETGPPRYGALAQTDRVAAETLIRSTILALANGTSITDVDEIVRRNATNVSPSDIQAGRLNTSVLGDIIGSVEQAKTSAGAPFNWSSATPAQIKDYLLAHGLSPFGDHHQLAMGLLRGLDGDGSGAGRGNGSINYGNISANFGVDRYGALTGFTHQMFNTQFKPLGYNESTARGVAAILGDREGLRGEALAARIREVAKDTKDRLGLDVNGYARDVATVGRDNTNDAVQYKQMLDQARQRFQAGDEEGAKQIIQDAAKFRAQHLNTIQSATPDIVPSATHIYEGLDIKAKRAEPRLAPLMNDAEKFRAGGNAVPTPTPAPAATQQQVSSLDQQGFFDDQPAAETNATDKNPPAKKNDSQPAAPNPTAKDAKKDEHGKDKPAEVKTAANIAAKPNSATKMTPAAPKLG